MNFLKTLPLTTTPGKPKKGDALRFNDRFQIVDEQFASRLWEETGLKDLVCGNEVGDEDEEGMSENERRELWLASFASVRMCYELIVIQGWGSHRP